MSRVFTVIRKEYLERVRAKSFVIGTILGPALMSMFIVLPILFADKGGDEERTIGLVDQTGGMLPELEAVLTDKGRDYIKLLPVGADQPFPDASVEDLKKMVLDGTIYAGVIIGPDFYTSRKATFYGQSVSSTVVREEILEPALDRVLREGRFAVAQVPDSLFNYLAARSDWSSINLTPEGEEEQQDEAASFVMAVVLIMIIYIMVIMYGNHTLTAVIEEKSSRMAELMLASVSPGSLMLGKVLGIGLAGLTQFAIWAGAFFFLSQKGVSVGEFTIDASFLSPIILISFVMFFLLGFFLYATLYAGIGAMCNTIQDSQQFNMPVTMGLVLPMMMLSLILRSPDSTLAVVLSLVPLFSPVLMFMRVCVETPPLWQIGLSWGLMALSIWLSATAAGKLFRVGILMYGAAPTWASLLKALRS